LASLATLFYLSTVFFYIKYRRGNNYAYYFAALLTALAASLTKEIAFTLPFILYVCDWIFLDQPTGARKKVWTLLPFLGIALLIPLLVHYGLPQREVLISTTRETAFFSRGEYFLTEINVIATYMRLLVVPIGQRVFYDYPIQQVLDFKTIVLFGVWAWLIAWAIRNAHRDKLRAFGILWFFITLSVESSIIPITDVIQEHRLYLPMLGFAIFLAVTLMKVVGNPDRLAKAFLTLIVIYAFLTYARNQDWQTEQGLWKDTVKKSPHSAIALSNLGEMYLLKGDFVQAKANFYEAIRIQPDPVDFINLSSIALAEKQWDKAADLAQKAMLFKQRNPAPALNNLGLAYLAQGQREKAIAIFEKARALDPGIIEPRTNLVNLYEQDQPEKALKIDEEILALKKGTR